MRVMVIMKASKDSEAEVELRPVFEAEDFGEEFTPEARGQEDRLRARMESKN